MLIRGRRPPPPTAGTFQFHSTKCVAQSRTRNSSPGLKHTWLSEWQGELVALRHTPAGDESVICVMHSRDKTLLLARKVCQLKHDKVYNKKLKQ